MRALRVPQHSLNTKGLEVLAFLQLSDKPSWLAAATRPRLGGVFGIPIFKRHLETLTLSTSGGSSAGDDFFQTKAGLSRQFGRLFKNLGLLLCPALIDHSVDPGLQLDKLAIREFSNSGDRHDLLLFPLSQNCQSRD
jgi:hypothetical protein